VQEEDVRHTRYGRQVKKVQRYDGVATLALCTFQDMLSTGAENVPQSIEECMES